MASVESRSRESAIPQKRYKSGLFARGWCADVEGVGAPPGSALAVKSVSEGRMSCHRPNDDVATPFQNSRALKIFTPSTCAHLGGCWVARGET